MSLRQRGLLAYSGGPIRSPLPPADTRANPPPCVARERRFAWKAGVSAIVEILLGRRRNGHSVQGFPKTPTTRETRLLARCGDFYDNRLTGERAVVLRADEDGDQPRSLLGNLIVSPGGAVVGEHVHPGLEERFVVVSGQLGMRLNGNERTLVAGEQATALRGEAHDWWNAGEEEASVLVEISPLNTRFVEMIATMFGLANAGETNAKGMPSPLRLALIGKEFEDVIQFTKPPRPIQQVMFALLGPIARLRGYRAIHPERLKPHGHLSPDPAVMTLAGLLPSAGPTSASELS